MNKGMICYTISKILLVEAALMTLPMLVALWYGESMEPFLIPILMLALAGLLLGACRPKRTELYARDGLAVTALAWIFMSVFGAMPFYISGATPSFIDGFFETVSGFTTTGATIFTEVEHLPRGLLFWRSFTHWIGGMGVLVFVMAILPMTDGHGMHLLRAEVPGPSVGKLVSRMSDTAKILYSIYFGLTMVEVCFLLAGGMPVYDSLIHAFGTAGTGGFSCRNLSIGAYQSPYLEIVTGVFMLLFGVNFNLYYFLLIRRFREVFRSEELRAYLLIVAAAVVTIALNIQHLCQGFGESLRLAFFQVASVITTTGYATADFNLWPTYSKSILVVLMFVGACAGSTGGGMKVARIVILAKTSLGDMRRILHPNAVSTVRFEDKPLPDKQIRSVHLFLTVFVLVYAASFLLLSLEGFDLVTTFTAVAACINNIGPGLEMVGPMGNFAAFSGLSKLLLAFDMLVGRLEIFPMLLLLAPSIWKQRRVDRRVPPVAL